MQRHNPRFILRNYIAQVAIEEAENGNFDEVNASNTFHFKI